MIQRFDSGPRMSEMTIHNGVAYLAGQVAEDTSVDIVGQTEQVLHAIDDLLKLAMTDKTNILRAEIFLADMADFAGMNEAWDQWVPQGATPARATVQAKLARPNWKIEIVVTAAVP
ncbi:aminoacrylate peracid reductase [Rhodanobacter sp. Soil772]|uniref:RidA family protein n=1 Tax=Rhodanobacter sp. Soil772 TaxID=1736406 RepID=UPI0007004AA5|nr:RidA family protein [Rhodanobacter sp. Soil772]KRE86827.1 aminoacrylate peracid reductase [Rhodanobacter sp. Soil772]